ncbi:MAG: hypothetical protein WCO05_02425 [Candidatus Moraniibacteriota bacterium]|jgi:hypothetical protein
MLAQAFFEGIIAALGALILELSPPIFGLTISETSLIFLLFTATIEEAIKFIFIYNHYAKLKVKEKILSGAFLIGLGFASIDIFLKQLSYEENLLFPIIGVFLVHILTTSLLGLFFRKNTTKQISLGIFFLGLNILVHFLYNLLILRLN